MSITTNLSVSPYFDDYNEDKDYYKILFRPGVPVQVRELNQLQTMLQKQVERFGDVVLKRGTIIDGCQPTFNTSIPYIKIKDLTAIGTSINVSEYDGYLLRSSSNLVSRVIDFSDGLESSDPDLKTFYLKYLNSGNSGDETSYVEGSVLTAYTEDYPIFSVRVNNGSEGFSNNDSVVVLSAIQVQNTTGGNTFGGSFVVGETITQPSTNATVEIVSVETLNDNTVLRVKPLTSQLAIANTRSWDLTVDDAFTASNSANEGVISSFIGSNANASLTTTNLGVVESINLERNGSEYEVAPFATISSSNASEIQIDTLDLEARNFKSRVTVATGLNSNAVGVAYGMSITGGKVYQKGHFLNVKGQSVIVQKYANTPNNLSVGFETVETVVNNAIDSTLVDNAAGFLNENAPGAHRLSLVPTLAIKTTEEAQEDPEFLALVKFSNGKFFSQQTNPQFNKVADELAKRTYEESGNYVLDPYQMTTVSAPTMAETANTFTYVIDPGHAYIAGYRVQTQRNFAQTVPKGINSASIANTSIELFYGNYVRVKEFAGLHAFSTASQISLRDTAAQYLSTNLDAITAPGVEIGKARVRSVVLENGVQGSSEAVYRVYLFDIRMNAGRNFRDVRSLYSDNATGLDGVADIITEALTGASSKDLVTKTVVTEEEDGSAGTITSQQSVIVEGANLYRNDVNTLLFGLPESTKAVSNIRYNCS